MHYALLAILALVFLAFTDSARSEDPYYIWVDEDGVTNYSQRNPRDVDAKLVSKSAPFGTKNAPTQRGIRPKRLPAGQSQAQPAPAPDASMDKEEQAVAEEIARIRASNCNIGKRNLAKLQAYARLRVNDPDGGDRVLTDEEKQQRIENAQKTIRDNCGAA